MVRNPFLKYELTEKMGILTIQFGQCGNQIGQSLFEYLVYDINQGKSLTSIKSSNVQYKNIVKELWFSGYKNNQYVPRSILVDTENKVVSSVINNCGSLKFKNIIAHNTGGSANNWAFGYTLKSDSLADEVVDAARKEIEKADNITHIVNILSSGGGTGSGVGSRTIESLRSSYPNKIIVNVVVLPYKNGEIVTQNYNTLLTLAKLYDITDGNILIENDSIHKICSSLLSIENVDFKHLNKIIAQKIRSVFQPALNYTPFDFVRHLTTHANYKFIQIKSTPYIPPECVTFESAPSWSILCGHLKKTLRTSNSITDFKNLKISNNQQPAAQSCKSVANLLISRGGSIPEDGAFSLLRDNELYPIWTRKNDQLKHFHETQMLHETGKFLALATNNNSIVHTFDTIVDQAWTLFKHRAYLHQYLKYNVSETDFEIAFEKIESILHNYKEL